MRKVDRSDALVPSILSGEKIKRWREDISSHFLLPDQERLKRRAPTIPELLQDSSIVESLYSAFEGKCAYCESRVNVAERGQVGHFRPPHNASNGNQKDSPDHYSWFSYEWRNLLLLCVECNRAKRNLFPVSGPRALPMCSWNEAQTTEKFLLLDPCSDIPSRHLSFTRDGLVRGTSRRGEITLKILNLNRPGLVEERKRVIDHTLQFFAMWNRHEVMERLSIDLRPGTSYSGVVYAYLYSVCQEIQRMTGIKILPASRVAETIDLILLNLSADTWRKAVENAPRLPLPVIEEIPEISFSKASDIARSSLVEGASWIRKIEIENFKGIHSLTLNVCPQERTSTAPSAMLLGENSTGKSSVLQAIALTLMGDAQRTRLRVSPEDFLSRERRYWHLIANRPLRVSIELDTGETISLAADDRTLRFVGEREPRSVILAYGSRRFFDSRKGRRARSSKCVTIFDPLATLPDPSDWLQNTDNYSFDAVARAMREVLALRSDDQILRDHEGRVLVRAHGREAPVSSMSDGYRSIFAMAIDIMREMVEVWRNLEDARGIVLIDEVETHLHPRWKMRVMSALRNAMPQVQFIATTHDPLCLRGMKNGEVQVLYRDEETDIQAVDDLPDVTGLRAEQLLTSDYFGLASTADPEIEDLLDKLARSAAHVEQQIIEDPSLKGVLGLSLFGDRPDQQIVAEALKRYLEQRTTSSSSRRTELREDAIRAVLDLLNKA